MAIQQGNLKVVTNGLQLYYNREFVKSFRGEATTNLIATYGNGAVNSYPSIGNQWATYNTNQYNNNTYFSIGSIVSVTGNLVTTSGNHPLRTYDVVRPQTTGGGVTAGTDYYVSKKSSTTFSLHTYNSTQDGSVSMDSILSPIASDTRISINATSFPTMWWGAPHLPNSGLIKQIIPNGFSFAGRLHDCLRLNWYRPDGVVDGMAYGVTPSYTGGAVYTFSAYVRAASQNAVGSTIRLDTYYSGPNVGGPSNSSPSLTYDWKKWTTTWTSNATSGAYLFYFWPEMGCPAQVDISEIQFEQKSYATPITFSSRSANTIAGGGGLIDLSGNGYQVDLNSSAVAFDSGGFYFNANAQGVLTTPVANSVLDNLSNNSHTYECWFKLLGTPPGLYSGYFFGRQGYHSGLSHRVANPNIIDTTTWYNDVTATGMSVTLSLNTWYHGVFVNDVENSVARLYINGSLSTSQSLTKQLRQYASTTPYYIGAASTDYASNSIVSIAKAYNRALTAAEILQNFNATRKTYNI
jgi:hypothetical protein